MQPLSRERKQANGLRSHHIAVVTALLTTLAVEYLAKPWLEARKGRILEEHLRRRQLQSSLKDLAVSIGIREKADAIWGAAPGATLKESHRLRSHIQRIGELLPQLHNWRTRSYVTSWLAKNIARLVGTVIALRADVTEPTPAREEARKLTLDAYQKLRPGVDYVLLRGRAHRQPLISKWRSLRAARRATKEENADGYLAA